MPQLRVAIVTEAWFPYVGGGQIYVREVARRLAEDHHCQVDIITRALRDESGRPWRINEQELGGQLRVIRLGPALRFEQLVGRLWYVAAAAWWLLRRRYDVLNPQAFLGGLPAKFVSLIHRTPVVYTIHGTVLFLPPPDSWRKRLERWIERWLLLGIRYDAEVTVAKNFLSLPNVNKRIVVIPNGVNAAEFDAVDVPKAETFTLLFVGRFDPVKGVADLLTAASLLKQRHHLPFRLVLVGSGPEGTRLQRLVAEKKLNDVVEFRGQLEYQELISVYKSAHLFVLPSHSEGFPLTLLEAWAAKVPVVATAVGESQLLVHDGVDGFLVPPHDPVALAAAIERAQAIPDLAKLGERGYATVAKRFQWDETTRQLFDVFHSVLTKKKIRRLESHEHQ